MFCRLASLVLTLATVVGCGVTRDDSTGATRQITSQVLRIDYANVKPESTLGELGCDNSKFIELIHKLEDAFDIAITEGEIEELLGANGMNNVTILELANLARSNRKL
ncbi:MAG: hypothetical protein KDB23_22910 [Planctomycetales bacterium]|nr:hypothetical protein [Planctomycetales bacterium]